MTITQIEKNLQKLISNFNQETFIFDLLLAYGTPKASIARLQNGNLNLFKGPGMVNWKKKVLFKEVFEQDLHRALADLKLQANHDQRFVIVTDYKQLVAFDMKTADTLDAEIENLPKHLDFFLPWAGMEKAQYAEENPADVRAAEKMARLYDEIRKDNPDTAPEFVHGLNVFLSRLLFCFFAEDTNIFKDKQFTGAIASHTQADGSDLHVYLDRLFEVLNTPKEQRKELPNYLNDFPYVNGGLFRHKHPSPVFTRRSRQVIIDSGELDWSAINPDIFGSMIQAVITPEHRGGLGMHYTSVPNIMKVIEPLFLTELYEAFEAAKGNPKKLNELLYRLSKIKIFDPACGSGNFLIIAYKELRKLEILILKERAKLSGKAGSGSLNFGGDYVSQISLANFYGIELDDFAHEIAQLSLWLAEHQMNVEFFKEFGQTSPTLPLKESGHIVHGNACRIDWETVCTKSPDSEVYILGNPPYLGFQERGVEQKKDMDLVFKGLGNVKRLDYIACWFKKATDFVEGNFICKFSFVSTNSISQGEQVSLIWPYIFEKNLEIEFAHQSFNWGNSAKNNAGVTVVIIGVSRKSTGQKFIFQDFTVKSVKSISPYLIEGSHTILFQRPSSISNFPEAVLGSSGIDGGHLILTPEERIEFINEDSRSEKFIKEFIGGGDFLNGIQRYCLWIPDEEVHQAEAILNINNRIQKCREFRLTAGRDAQKAASVPHRFFYRKHTDGKAIIFPMTSSGRRNYLPIGYSNKNAIVSNGAFVIYNPPTFLFGVISSKIHCLWMSVTSARMRNDYRYSVNLTYNNFPFPTLSEERKVEINQCVFRILEEREKHPEKTLAELYDPDKMPAGLRAAHQANDEVIERCYRSKPFESDEERLEYLFKLYEKMIAEEQTRGSLFEKEKKKSKKKA
ncbi:MAG: class I SAM-dependent DNA methyltransferase [Algoriphagus aquaeductus]|uniref:class I SAM-dependent DNA methyltransferase n=1 Tax=Algoriphagus aquaeductus TaxID=475299 RepID=UPI0038795895